MRKLSAKTLCGLLILGMVSLNAAAQKFDVSWGSNAKLKYDFDDAVPLVNGQFLVLKLQTKGGGMFSKAKTIPTIMLVDKNSETVKERVLEVEEGNSSLKGFEKYGNNIFFMYNSYDKDSKTTSLFALKIDESTLAPLSKTTLGTFEDDSRSDQAQVTYKLSSDSSKLLVFAEGPDRKKEDEKFYVGVFDTDLKNIWKREVDLPIIQKFVSLYDEDVTNDGKVYVAIKHYDKEVSRESVRDNGDKIPSYTYKLLVYSNASDKEKEIGFNLSNNYIEGTKLIYDKKGTVTAAGLYKVKPNGRLTGVFYASFDPNTSEVKSPKIVEFPGEFITQIDKDDYASDSKSDPGLYQHFRINHILARENGSVDLVSEYYRLDVITTYDARTGQSHTTYRYHYGDIVNTNIDKSGKAVFTRVPKNQKWSSEAYGSDFFLGYYPLIYKDKLVLLFNDDKDNVDRDLSKKPDDVMKFKKSTLVAATINAKGDLSREAIYDNDDEDFVTMPRNFARMSDNTYLISSDLLKMFKKRTRFGVLKVK